MNVVVLDAEQQLGFSTNRLIFFDFRPDQEGSVFYPAEALQLDMPRDSLVIGNVSRQEPAQH